MLPASFARFHRLGAILLLGFASGLPLALTGQAMQAWLTVGGVDIVTIGFLGLVGLPYTFKFLWAPLMDRFELPWFGRRRGWLVLTQLALAGLLLAMSRLSPSATPGLFALAAVAVAFFSASQDVVVDAYRTDVVADPDEQDLGASMHVMSYRFAMIVSGGVSLIWADQWDWPTVYRIMAAIMFGAALSSLLIAPRIAVSSTLHLTDARKDLRGFIAMLLAVLVGYGIAHTTLQLVGFNPDDKNKWVQLLFVASEIAVALPLALWAARKANFEILNQSLASYFVLPSAGAFLVLIILYKLGDAFAGSLTTSFLIKGMAFSQSEIGIANKIIGAWMTIFGAFVGGLILVRLRLYRALLFFGVLQLASNFGFYVLAKLGKGAWGAVMVQPFDWTIIALKEPASLDWLLMAVIAGENITGGMGTVAFVALLMALCRQQTGGQSFTATHYALLSAAAAVGRIYVSPLSGVLSESFGWPGFFLFSVLMAVPGVLMVWWMRRSIRTLVPPEKVAADAD